MSKPAVYGNNPIVQDLGVCDPHVHIFGDRAYLYAGQDSDPHAPTYAIGNWVIYSSDDLLHWQRECTLLPTQTYMGDSDRCWATDAAERGGRYYFYFSNGSDETGVMVSDRPGDGFIDARGGPLLPADCCPTKPYDPCVFTDDDGASYILVGTPVWAGGDSYYMARLHDDMVSLAEPLRKVLVDDEADDKPALHKYGGRYYLSWASHYAVSDCVYGPYAYLGNTGAANDHGNFFCWRGQWFQSFTIYDPHQAHRASGLCYIHYRANGEMVADDRIIEYGVGQYDAYWNRIEAEWYMAAEGVDKRERQHAGFEVVGTDGGWIRFPNMHNLPENAEVSLFARCAAREGGAVELHAGTADGPLLGVCPVRYTGPYADWRAYRCFVAPLRNPAGKLDLALVFRGGPVQLDWFKFYRGR